MGRNGDIKELIQSSYEELGGSSVDKAFKGVLTEIVTEEMLERYSKKYPDDYLSLFRDFENKKRIYRKGQVCSWTTPVSFNEECLETLGKDLTILINNSRYKDNFLFRSGRLRIKSFEIFFQSTCSGIIKLVEKFFQTHKLENVNKILMVGGFSESSILQEEVLKAFPCHIFVPEEAGLAVLRGAVMFGCFQRFTSSRVSRYLYV